MATNQKPDRVYLRFTPEEIEVIQSVVADFQKLNLRIGTTMVVKWLFSQGIASYQKDGLSFRPRRKPISPSEFISGPSQSTD